MTTLYYIRHAEPDHANKDGFARPLTKKGQADALRIAEMLADVDFAAVYSSPAKRAVDTVVPLAAKMGKPIVTNSAFMERIVGDEWVADADFLPYVQAQWADFSYKLSGGECLAEVQQRNIKSINELLDRHKVESFAIGGHGTALLTILHYYDNKICYDDFVQMVHLTPHIVRFSFEDVSAIDKPQIEHTYIKRNEDNQE